MTLKSVWKNKKGFALETAILFTFMIASLCFLMTSVALIGRYDTHIRGLEVQRDMTIEQIGEYFLASVKEETVYEDFGDSGYYKGGRYRYTVNDSVPRVCVLRVWDGATDTMVLYVKTERDPNGEVAVTAWRYSDPTVPEA